MKRSVFDEKSLDTIYEEIRTVYLSDDRPWILGFSGGKDSTCMIQMAWNALKNLPRDKLTKNIHVISSDTLIESPQIVDRITGSLARIEEAAKMDGLPITTNLLRPPTSDTFWVRVLGMGYPAPTPMFRWCTEMLKISNADRFIREKVSEHGEVIVLLGTRKSESSTRQQTMNLLEIKNSVLSHHKTYAQTYVYTPLVDFETDDVWNYLLQNKNPWGENNRDLLALYQDANAAECPLVVDTSTPSCGGGRFGCWTCTVVEKQKSLDGMIESGEDWMEPLAELRHELKKSQDPKVWPDIRRITRRNGRVDLRNDGSDYTPGPYTLEFRKDYLRKLLKGQARIRKTEKGCGMVLISEDEIREIQKIWRKEEGDWQDTAYAIYQDVTGINMKPDSMEIGSFGANEQRILEEICKAQEMPYRLVSCLINAEVDFQRRGRHAGVFAAIGKELGKEWRTDVDGIRADLFRYRDMKEEIKS